MVECGAFNRRSPANVIGLKRQIVQVVEHDPGWQALAAEACQTLQSVCGELLVDLQHVGSTAVPNLPAKPILDIAAAVATFDSLPELIRGLTSAGYLYRGDLGSDGGQFFLAESSPDVRTVHVHVVVHDGSQWQSYILFRDLLRSRPAIRKRYAELKAKLASTYRKDRESYTASKAAFIREILEGNVVRTENSGTGTMSGDE